MRCKTRRGVAMALVLAAGSAASAAVVSWSNAAGGDWGVAANWNPAAVPGGADDVIINLAGTYTVSTGAVNRAAATLSIGNANATVGIDDARTLSVASISNNGLVVINPSGGVNATNLLMAATSTISGTGTIRLNATAGNLARANLTYNSSLNAITQSAGHTIAGMGNVLINLTNLGVVSADQNGQVLSLNTLPKSNAGVMRAINGGILEISGVAVGNTGGEIRADGGTVRLLGNSTVGGGTLRAINGGAIAVETGNATIGGVTIVGPLNVRDARTLGVNGDVTNNGLITVNSDGGVNASNLTIAANSVFTGNGTIRLDATAGNLARANLTYTSSLLQFTNGPSHTIAGRGNLFARLLNNGTVTADNPGETLLLSTLPKTNANIMRATNGGVLGVSGITLTQVGSGRLQAVNSTVSLSGGAVVDGGIIEASGASGKISIDSGNATVAGPITLSGPVDVNDARVLVWTDAVTNNGTITVNPTGGLNGTYLQLNSPAGTIQGTGEIVLNATGGGLDRAYLWYNSSLNVMTQAAGHTIRGKGNVYTRLVNNGLVSADQNGQALQLLSLPKTNNATMRAVNGGVLQFSGTDVTQDPGAKISADGGAVTLVGGTSVTGGLIEAKNGGRVSVGTGNAILAGPVTLSGPIDVDDARILVWTGTVTNNGTITVNAQGGANPTLMQLNASPGTIQGTGEIVLNATGGGLDRAYLWYNSSLNVMTQAAGHTIRGKGNVYTRLVNNGLVSADQNGETLQLLSQPKTNNATMRAVNGGVLQFNGTAVTQDPGAKISADGGRVTLVGGTSVTGGLIEAKNGGRVSVGSGNAILAGPVTLSGPVDVDDARNLVWTGTVTNNGTITVNAQAGANPTLMQLNASPGTLQGTGKVVLNATGGANDRAYLWYNSSLNVLTNGPGHTIAGEGNVYTRLVNQGIISPGDAAAATGEIGTLGMLTNPKTFAPGGEISFQLGGTPASQEFDRLTGNAALTLGGRVSFEEINGYTPTIGDVFPIIRTSGAVSGIFDFVGQLSSTPGAVYRVAYRADGADLVVTCVADLTADVLLDFGDVSKFLIAFNDGSLEADLNNDGIVDFGDVSLFVGLFNAPCN